MSSLVTKKGAEATGETSTAKSRNFRGVYCFDMMSNDLCAYEDRSRFSSPKISDLIVFRSMIGSLKFPREGETEAEVLSNNRSHGHGANQMIVKQPKASDHHVWV